MNRGRSLLAASIVKMDGVFQRGDTIYIANSDTEKDFARGLTNYSNKVLEKIKGKNDRNEKNYKRN
ncbi:MAG: hypothetical protein LE168_01355 [Endomicrobium sp.]|nr:hypothetical protein [Endomicrobium sp.]